jgi:4-amino-4-deoxy-L-arabinose transferase-like glycosyltransferase
VRLSHEAVLVIVAVAVAFALRMGFGAWAASVPPPLSDAEYYDAAARSLAAGDGYSVLLTPEGFRPGGEATAFYPPGYSIFLGAGYAILGEEVAVGRALNAVAGALTVVPVWWLGRRLYGPAAGVAAGALIALSPSLIAWTPVLLSETWFTLLFAIALVAVAPLLDRGARSGAGSALVAGAAIGLAALVRGQAAVLLPAVLVALLWQRRSTSDALRTTALVAVSAAVVLTPWAVRSSLAMDSPVLLSTNFGYNLRVGHAPYSSGRYETPHDLWAEPASSFRELEVTFNDAGRDRAVDYAIGHPIREVELSVRKVVGLWRPDTDALTWVASYGLTPLPDGSEAPLKAAIVGGYVLLLALAAYGMARAGEEYARFAVAAVLLWTVVHVVFFGEPRYHVPLLVLLAPPAGRSAARLAAGFSGRVRAGARQTLTPET